MRARCAATSRIWWRQAVEQARAVADDLFADDLEIIALRADYEVKQRQRPVLALANPQLLVLAIEDLKERIKIATTEAVFAATEDVMAGDTSLRRAMVFQEQIDEHTRKLAPLTIALERFNKFGLGNAARQREQQAGQALEAALMERKRQHVREHPEAAAAPAAAEPLDTVVEI
jgi:hypothetical protein